MNISQSLFMALAPAEQRNTIEALIFAASKDEALTTENIRKLVLADIIKEHNKNKKNAKTSGNVNEYPNHNGEELNSELSNGTDINSNNNDFNSTESEVTEKANGNETRPIPPEEPATPALEDILPLAKIARIINDINHELEQSNRPYRIVDFAGCYQFATTPQHGELVENMLSAKTRKRFTNAQLETLAIIAYKQPITKPEIDKIRGVMSSSEIINTLAEKELIAIAGRKDILGKPLLYATTDEFLRVFGLKQLADLPRLTEIEEMVEADLNEKQKEEEVVFSAEAD